MNILIIGGVAGGATCLPKLRSSEGRRAEKLLPVGDAIKEKC